jgi:hypothetical protein
MDKMQLKNAILVRESIIRANEIVISEYKAQLCQARTAGADEDYLKNRIENFTAEKRIAEAELLQFRKLLTEIGEKNGEN